MWWNILPAWVITGSLVYLPGVVCAAGAYVYTGCIRGRDMGGYYNQYMIFRDERILHGRDPFRQHKNLGLDGVPDN